VGFGQFMMHYAISLIRLRGIAARCIFIIDRGEHVGGCLYQANTFGWFGAPSNPLVFYPHEIYGSCHSKMSFDPLGVSSVCGLANMHIVQEHFGLRVYLRTHWSDVEPLLDAATRVVKPAYRDVINGRQPGATNGLNNIELSAAKFNLIGMGSTVGDVIVELVRRRATTHGHDFHVILHYRTPRRYTTYMGTLVQCPGVFPYYSSGPMSSLGLDIDKAILESSERKHPELTRILEEFVRYIKQSFKEGKTFSFAAIMNVLTYHPMVASKMQFNRIGDRSDVQGAPGELLDCTNKVNYNDVGEDDQPTKKVNIAPNMLGNIPPPQELLFGRARLPGPLSGQWSTGLGAMGQVLQPHNAYDVTSGVVGCVAQCNSVFYFARYHALARAFLVFQFRPYSVQFVTARVFDFLMHLLAFTGFTYLFFDASLFSRTPHQSPEQNFAIITARWKWYSEQLLYSGPDAQFPSSLHALPGVPKRFSFAWMASNKESLIVRMLLTLLIAAIVSWCIVSRDTIRDILTPIMEALTRQ